MERVKTIAWWVVAALFLLWTLAAFPSLGCLFFLIGAAVSAPVPAVRDFWEEKGLRGAPKVALAVALLIAGAIAAPDSVKERGAEKEPPSEAAETVEAAPSSEIESVTGGEETPPEEVTESAPTPEIEIPENAILLVAGEKGEYGKYTAMNKETFYAYYLPGGVYSVTNAGEYPAQVSVYEGIQWNAETGFDEYSADGGALRLEVGESGEITIPDGWFVEIREPDKAAFVRISDAPEPEPAEETPEPAPKLTGKEKVDADLRAIVAEHYANTVVDSITLNNNYGTDEDGDYVALIYLTWNVQNGADMTKRMIKMYSEDFAARIATDVLEVTDVAMFWTIPYHHIEGSTLPEAKYSYEKHGIGMYQTDEMWSKSVS